MWPVSPELLDGLRYSRVMASKIDIYHVDSIGRATLAMGNVPIIGGAVTCDRKSNTRRSLNCEVILEYPYDGYTDMINSTNTRIQAWRGISFAQRTEWVPVGVFRVDSVQQAGMGSLQISGSGLEIMVIENRFVAPYTTAAGSATVEITKLITESIVGVTVLNRCTNEYTIGKRTWPRDRWDGINELADALIADVYCAPDGTFIIANSPSLEFSPIQWVVDEGPGGVLVELSQVEDREGVYNAVIATGQTNENGVPVVSGEAYDLDPLSPTYWHGGFGHVPKFYSNPQFTTPEMCTNTAKSMLEESRAQSKTLTFSTIPNPALEPGDAVMVAMLDGSFEKHILQSFTVPLGDGNMTAETMAITKPEDPEVIASGMPMLPAMAQYLSKNVSERMIKARAPQVNAHA